jgi:hypothetical protein
LAHLASFFYLAIAFVSPPVPEPGTMSPHAALKADGAKRQAFISSRR